MPLRLEIIDDHGKPLHVKAARVVVYDAATDNPIALAHEFSPGVFIATCAGNDDFNKMLQSLGIDRTLIVDKIDTEFLS